GAVKTGSARIVWSAATAGQGELRPFTPGPYTAGEHRVTPPADATGAAGLPCERGTFRFGDNDPPAPLVAQTRRRSLGAQQAHLRRPGRHGRARPRAGRQRRGGDRPAGATRRADRTAAPAAGGRRPAPSRHLRPALPAGRRRAPGAVVRRGPPVPAAQPAA